MSTSPTTLLSADPTSLAAAQANVLACSIANVAMLNGGLKTLYASAYADYVANMQSGENIPADRRAPPTPPNAWELAPPNADGFVFYEIGTTPVSPQGAAVTPNSDYTVNTVANVIMIGGPSSQAPGNKWYTALVGDTFPSGMTTPPQPDGHTYEKFGAPVGPGWYLQVS
jgi:hypothetical protein